MAAVEAVLKRNGLNPGAVSANHLAIQIHGTSARMAEAFQTTFRRYVVAGGRMSYANTSAPLLDGSIVASVQGVIGLDDLVQAHPEGARRPARPLRAAAWRRHMSLPVDRNRAPPRPRRPPPAVR